MENRDSEFDKFAAEYESMHAANIGASGEPPAYFAEYKVRDVADLISRKRKGSPQTIVDFGSGIGTSVPYLRKFFPDSSLVCLDVSQTSIKLAMSRFESEAKFMQFDGETVPLKDDSVDLVFVACVFHHISPNDHVRLIAELKRIIKPGGTLFLYEHNPYNPVTVHSVNTCPLDENAILIRPGNMLRTFRYAGFARPILRYRVFFPRVLSMLRPLENHLGWCPIGAQYAVFATK